MLGLLLLLLRCLALPSHQLSQLHMQYTASFTGGPLPGRLSRLAALRQEEEGTADSPALVLCPQVALSGDYPSYMDAQREVQMLQLAGAALPDSSRPPGVVQLLDSFPVATDSGRHLCLVTEQLGDSLGSILYRCAVLAWPGMACL